MLTSSLLLALISCGSRGDQVGYLSPDDDLSGLTDWACFDDAGVDCADDGPHIRGTCCTYGDPLQAVGFADFNEAVDLETDGEHAVVCTGFGVGATRVDDPSDLRFTQRLGGRCQRAAFGPELGSTKVVYTAHHGDGWVPSPALTTWHLAPDGTLTEVHDIENDDVLFEGLVFHRGKLFVAAHAGGVRIYEPRDDGSPRFEQTIDGFDNAVKLDASVDHVYVIDQAHLRRIDVVNPSRIRLDGSVKTPGKPRDVDVAEDRVYVALGNDGLAVYDLELNLVEHIDMDGSVQAVAVDRDVIATANWSHLSVVDANDFRLLATEQLLRGFEQDLGIGISGHRIYAAEWGGLYGLEYRPGYVSSDIRVAEELFSFSADQSATRDVLVGNRGPLDLVVSSIETSHGAWSASPRDFVVESGTKDQRVTLSFEPTGDSLDETLRIDNNDADSVQNPLTLPLVASESGDIDVGDRLDDWFAFLDPTGEEDLDNLRGHVIVLAYFALF